MRFVLRHGATEIDVTGSPATIGRDRDCRIVLADRMVSRRHARLVETEDGMTIEDLGSRNGVFVNQRRISEPTLLAHGDVIGVGLETLEVVDLHVVPRRRQATDPMPYETPDVDGPEPATITTKLDVLSEREREVFHMIVLGFTQREIADRLHVSVKTVESHRAHIAEKLECRTRAELVAYAITAGVLRRGDM